MLLIQFSGTQSTGKTTLSNSLSRQYDNSFVIGGIVRKLISLGEVKSLPPFESSDQLKIFLELSYHFISDILMGKKNIVFSERTFVDMLAYSRYYLGKVSYIEDIAKRLIDQTCFQNERFDILTFYIPPVIPFMEDGIRDKHSFYDIDIIIKDILKEFGVPYLRLDEILLEDRLKRVLEEVEKIRVLSK